MKLIIASRNSGKILEIKQIISLPKIEILIYKDFTTWPLISEGNQSFKDNAVLKAKKVQEFFGIAALADDSGLEVDALEGKPGVLSARYAGANATDQENNQKLLRALDNLELAKRTARFRCVAACSFPDGRILTAEDICEGIISLEPKGTNGFGYDPIFMPLGKNKTMAELTREEKQAISHRGKALRKIKKLLSLNI
jgi:XTP/dITP diphosphohydrolase